MNFEEDIRKMKRAALNFYLQTRPPSKDDTPKLDTYFGGKPYITNEKELHACPYCQTKTEFVMQIYMPDPKNSSVRKLYSFYYCFRCAKTGKNFTFVMNIYLNPREEAMMKLENYKPMIPYCTLKFLPVYELPEWELCEKLFPDFVSRFKKTYGDKAIDEYMRLKNRVENSTWDTNLKIKGYPKFIDYDEIPICDRTNQRMELFFQLENLPFLGINWTNHENSGLYVFKTPDLENFTVMPYIYV